MQIVPDMDDWESDGDGITNGDGCGYPCSGDGIRRVRGMIAWIQ